MYQVLAGFSLLASAVFIFSLALYNLVEEKHKKVLSILDASARLALTALVVLTCTAISYKGYELIQSDAVRYQELKREADARMFTYCSELYTQDPTEYHRRCY